MRLFLSFPHSFLFLRHRWRCGTVPSVRITRHDELHCRTSGSGHPWPRCPYRCCRLKTRCRCRRQLWERCTVLSEAVCCACPKYSCTEYRAWLAAGLIRTAVFRRDMVRRQRGNFNLVTKIVLIHEHAVSTSFQPFSSELPSFCLDLKIGMCKATVIHFDTLLSWVWNQAGRKIID